MWPNSLRLALPERAEGKAGGQPAQTDTDPSSEYRNPTSGSMEETSGTPTPTQPISEVVEETPALGEYASDRFL